MTQRLPSKWWGGDQPLTICSAQTALAFPPDDADVGIIKNMANASHWGEANEFDLQIFAAGTVDLTAAKLYKMSLQPYTFDDSTFTTDYATDNKLDDTAHGLSTGTGPVFVSSSGTLPAGLAAYAPATTGTAGLYWVKSSSANEILLFPSLEKAFAGQAGDQVALTSDGSGTHTMSDNPNDGITQTMRVCFHQIGLLGDDVSGTLTCELTADKGWQDRFFHSRDAIGYAVSATFSDTVAVTIVAKPVNKVRGA